MNIIGYVNVNYIVKLSSAKLDPYVMVSVWCAGSAYTFVWTISHRCYCTKFNTFTFDGQASWRTNERTKRSFLLFLSLRYLSSLQLIPLCVCINHFRFFSFSVFFFHHIYVRSRVLKNLTTTYIRLLLSNLCAFLLSFFSD